MTAKYKSESDIPAREAIDQSGKLPPFWEVMEGEEMKSSMILLILNEIRRSNPNVETPESSMCRMSKLRGYLELMELADYLNNQGSEEIEPDDELQS